MHFLSNFGCKIIFVCANNFWHQQDSNSLFKGTMGHMTSQGKKPIESLKNGKCVLKLSLNCHSLTCTKSIKYLKTLKCVLESPSIVLEFFCSKKGMNCGTEAVPQKNELGKRKFGKAFKFCLCGRVLVKKFFFATQARSFMY